MVLQIPCIREVSGLRGVAEHDESRWADGALIREGNLESGVVEFRSRIKVLGIPDDVIEDVGWDAAVIRLMDLKDLRKDILAAKS